MRYVQVVLTDAHADLLAKASQLMLDQLDAQPNIAPPGLADQYEFLRSFLAEVAAKPEAYPVNGNVARSIKTRLRKLKGEAQRPPRPRRETRHKRRIEAAKARRAARRSSS